jgi:hypothetical protein
VHVRSTSGLSARRVPARVVAKWGCRRRAITLFAEKCPCLYLHLATSQQHHSDIDTAPLNNTLYITTKKERSLYRSLCASTTATTSRAFSNYPIMSTNGESPAPEAAGDSRDPSGFLSEIIGAPVTVKLNSGIVYKGK